MTLILANNDLLLNIDSLNNVIVLVSNNDLFFDHCIGNDCFLLTMLLDDGSLLQVGT